MRRSVFMIFSCACVNGYTVPALAQAPPAPNPGLWFPASVVNPGGLRPVPMLVYHPASGLLIIDTRGIDRISNTIGANNIAGDDVGMNAVRLTCPPGVFLDQFNGSGGGLFWNSFYANGQMQCIASPNGAAAFLNPPAAYPFAQLPAGLGPSAFGQVDMTIAFDRFVGAALIGSVQFDSGCGTTPACAADINCSGPPIRLSVQDIFDFLAAYFMGDPRADFNGSGLPVTVQDIFDFLAAYFAGCP